MAHKHTCIDCGRTIEEGDFDCDEDRDHDYRRCDKCASKRASDVDPNDI
jgi:DNA-directed RNA polymerase subunit RPC12/RpoP